jgi:hypoxanthine phosphoribosyltransferase
MVTYYISQNIHQITVVAVLQGGMFIAVDLIKAMTAYLRHEVNDKNKCKFYLKIKTDTIFLSSYEKGLTSKGVLRIEKDLTEDPTGLHILIVDDMLDSGFSLSEYKRKLYESGRIPASLKFFFMVNRDVGKEKPMLADFYMLTYKGDKYLIGYGLDYNLEHRNLPYISTLK